MAGPASLSFLLLALLLAFSSGTSTAEIKCAEVMTALSSCISYGRSGGEMVPPACCTAVKNLNMVKSTPDRQQVCVCLKSLFSQIRNIQMSYASQIPAKCGVNLGYPISLSVDCSKVK